MKNKFGKIGYMNDLCEGCHTYRYEEENEFDGKTVINYCQHSEFNIAGDYCPCTSCLVKVNCVKSCQQMALWCAKVHGRKHSHEEEPQRKES